MQLEKVRLRSSAFGFPKVGQKHSLSLKNFFMGLAGNFIAAGIGWYVKGPNTGLIIAGVGVILLLAVFLFTKKSATPIIPAASPVNVHQENKQEFNPQFNPTFSPQQNVFVGIADPNVISTEKEKASQESIMTQYMRKTHPTSGYLIDEVARDLNLSMPDVRDIMERLRAKQVVWRVNLNQAVGGVGYFLDELHRPNPQPQPRKPNAVDVYRIEKDPPKS